MFSGKCRMDSLFSTTTVLLSNEYVENFSFEKLMSKLRKVRKETGITFKKIKKTFALVGSYDMIQAAFQLLKLWLERPDLEPLGDCTIGEFDQIELQNEILWNTSHINKPLSETLSNFTSNYVSLEDHLISIDKMKQEIEKGKLIQEKELNKFENTEFVFSQNKYPSGVGALEQQPFIAEKESGSSENSKFLTAIEHDFSDSKTRASRLKAIKFVKDVLKHESADLFDHQSRRSARKQLGNVNSKISWKKEKKRKKSSVDQKIQCSKCDVVLRSRKRLNEHLKRIHMKQFKCSVCQKRFGYPTDLHRHKCHGKPEYHEDGSVKPSTKKAKMPELLPCKECNYMALSKKRYNEHVKRKHKLTHKCGSCDKYFGFIKDLSRHKENVHAEPTHFCDKCSRFFKSKSLFDQHMKTHDEGYIRPNFTCQICQKSFTTKYVMATHIKGEHLGMKKMWLCSHCGKKFSQRNSYKMHMNAHQGIKPYICDLCGKSFTYDKSLKEHRYMHDSVRRFQCTQCSKTFRQKTTLRVHMKVHTETKDHVCKTCGRGFNQKQALERHERIHTGIKPYTCSICQRNFGDSSTIRRHMLAIHKKSADNWRDDIITAARPKSNYYIEGGSGHNRNYKKKSSSFMSKNYERDKEIGKKLKKNRNGQENKCLSHEEHLAERERPISQRHMITDAEFIAEPYSEIQNQQTLTEQTKQHSFHQDTYSPNLQYGTLPGQPSQANIEHRNIDIDMQNDHNTPTYNFPANIQQHSQDTFQDELLISTIFQQRQLQQSAVYLPVLTPLTSVTDITVSEPQQGQTDAVLSQAVPNIWGCSGYPAAYINPSSYTSFQGHQG